MSNETEIAILAGGCFWGVEAVFEHVKGVVEVVSGYAGGSEEQAVYDLVVSGLTGHAESVRIVFDPEQVTYGRLLQVYFSVAHDPTQLDRQGPDYGKHYRSHVFHVDQAQRDVVTAYIDQLTDEGLFPRAIVTRLDPLEAFYLAEEEHQDFVARNPEEPYVVFYDLPKLENLRRLFPELYRVP
jgi:peptide-methionine (S)-S-oxide reductase